MYPEFNNPSYKDGNPVSRMPGAPLGTEYLFVRLLTHQLSWSFLLSHLSRNVRAYKLTVRPVPFPVFSIFLFSALFLLFFVCLCSYVLLCFVYDWTFCSVLDFLEAGVTKL